MIKTLAPKLTPREKRHAKQVRELQRWHTKVKKAIDVLAKSKTAIPRLEKQLERYDRQVAMNSPLEKAEPVEVEQPAPQVISGVQMMDDLKVPAFLDRNKTEEETKAEIAAEQAATKSAKARGRVAKMLAKKSGETKRMPLSGKDALKFIDGLS